MLLNVELSYDPRSWCPGSLQSFVNMFTPKIFSVPLIIILIWSVLYFTRAAQLMTTNNNIFSTVTVDSVFPLCAQGEVEFGWTLVSLPLCACSPLTASAEWGHSSPATNQFMPNCPPRAPTPFSWSFFLAVGKYQKRCITATHWFDYWINSRSQRQTNKQKTKQINQTTDFTQNIYLSLKKQICKYGLIVLFLVFF